MAVGRNDRALTEESVAQPGRRLREVFRRSGFGGTPSCTAPQVEVRLYNGGSLQKGPFYVLFYR